MHVSCRLRCDKSDTYLSVRFEKKKTAVKVLEGQIQKLLDSSDGPSEEVAAQKAAFVEAIRKEEAREYSPSPWWSYIKTAALF